MNLSEALLAALAGHGAQQIFGIPGDFVLPFFREVERSRILPLYTLSNEPSVGFAADGAARILGAPSVAAVTYGAGALNMVNAIAGAYAERSPVVVISGGPGKGESASGLLLHHQAKRLDSQFEIYREITCDQARLDNAATAPDAIARVLASCVREARPVYLELPRDMATARCEPVTALPPERVDTEALAACVEEVFARLASARSPVLMIGVEVRRYGVEAEVAALAASLGIPVVTSFMGHGLLANADPPPLGAYLGVAGDPVITDLVENADLLILLGVIVSDTNLGVSRRKIDLRRAILALEGNVTLGFHVYPRMPLRDVVVAMAQRARTGTPARMRVAPRVAPAAPEPETGTRLTPGAITQAVNDLFAQHGRMPLAVDVGDCLFASMDIGPTQRIAPGYYATMGFGVPAGLGLQAASGERPLILVGDGAFQMSGWELGNCRRYGWDPIVVVFNNAAWGMLQCFEPGARFNTLDEWHFASMAEGMGGVGVRVDSANGFREALFRAASTRGRFQLIEARIPSGVLSPTLARYVEGVRRVAAGITA